MSSSISTLGVFHQATQSVSIRPPWSLPEDVFQALCSGCGACRDECPRGILQKGIDGLPFIDFALGACNLCGECVDACARGALARRYHGASWGPWRLKAHITEDCLGNQGVMCRQCVDECRAHAIQLTSSGGLPSIDLLVCNGCGACFSNCPAAAISLYTDSPL